MTTTAPRRTQEERSTATRALLLDATIECIIELGYNATTTSEIVRRAGVSRGAQVHHFPTKAELVRSAVEHLARKGEEELRREFARIDAKGGDLTSQAIDLLWSGYAGPLFTAVLELIVSARTDPELAEVMSSLHLNVEEAVERFCVETLGPRAIKRKGFRDGIALTVNLMHGLALTRVVGTRPGEQDRLVEVWKRLVRPLFEIDERGRHD